MKTFVLALVLLSASVCVAGQEPTPAAPAKDTSVLKDDCDCGSSSSCSDCSIRRRGLFGRRGYVINKVSVEGNTVTTSRQVIDGCCNTIRCTTTTDSCDSCCGRTRSVTRSWGRRGCCSCTSCDSCK